MRGRRALRAAWAARRAAWAAGFVWSGAGPGDFGPHDPARSAAFDSCACGQGLHDLQAATALRGGIAGELRTAGSTLVGDGDPHAGRAPADLQSEPAALAAGRVADGVSRQLRYDRDHVVAAGARWQQRGNPVSQFAYLRRAALTGAAPAQPWHGDGSPPGCRAHGRPPCAGGADAAAGWRPCAQTDSIPQLQSIWPLTGAYRRTRPCGFRCRAPTGRDRLGACTAALLRWN